ncbi:hypothetical protein CEXT_494591 [Caerostris extrusa]|uniref:Homing endonuclease LAGLIDADG domain-containing protein n=1 Tax=Caerostris extrusa TaxID=172846 RepID=A0AAV4UIV3_CAEEX|nr:hypothetical protein CEXT_494591 [Caerostris extrusa]
MKQAKELKTIGKKIPREREATFGTSKLFKNGEYHNTKHLRRKIIEAIFGRRHNFTESIGNRDVISGPLLYIYLICIFCYPITLFTEDEEERFQTVQVMPNRKLLGLINPLIKHPRIGTGVLDNFCYYFYVGDRHNKSPDWPDSPQATQLFQETLGSRPNKPCKDERFRVYSIRGHKKNIGWEILLLG